MGGPTLNNIFYKPDIGASGAVEKGKFDDGLDVADGLIEGNKPANNKLSAFAPTTSLELAGVISDEIGAGKLRFDTSVTAKTTTATLTTAEAGTILCSAAGGAYTITLPTAVGNLGLTYHFVKTDANYTLITLDGDGTETFNYENATGAPVLTYSRLNTYCAEVTVVSDGTNWQCINERLGQVPEAKITSSADQPDLINATATLVILDAEGYDIGSNFNNTASNYKFTCPISGTYVISGIAFFSNTVADKLMVAYIYKNGVSINSVLAQTSMASYFGITIYCEGNFVATNYIQLYVKSNSGGNTVDLSAGNMMTIRLISKD